MNHDRRLKKSKNRMLAGVCGGIAEYIGWPAAHVRVVYVLVSVLSAAFPGMLVYVVLALAMPPPDRQRRFRLDDYRVQ
ncbi:PspC domain-containing protein [Chiayiivirga flava]|uniref:Phage shock protein C n=1 Tax=Chiayiivirga flava TaxID=659595 RepID=A0A7W8D5C5_9GAMM|nr:PspC domain-containing protein [Chiayiivirga flava]MBB5207090.1 phage shock protein C [Chiayiivirga flava]